MNVSTTMQICFSVKILLKVLNKNFCTAVYNLVKNGHTCALSHLTHTQQKQKSIKMLHTMPKKPKKKTNTKQEQTNVNNTI